MLFLAYRRDARMLMVAGPRARTPTALLARRSSNKSARPRYKRRGRPDRQFKD